MIIYKVLTKDEFLTLENEGETFGSKKDLLDGFIHFSQKEQLRGDVLKVNSSNENVRKVLQTGTKIDLDGSPSG